MLYMSSANRIIRIHAPFVSDNEIEKINNSLRSQAEPDYVDEILNFADEKEIGDSSKNLNDKDELYQAALEIIKSEGKASTSFLQRKLQIGYNFQFLFQLLASNLTSHQPRQLCKALEVCAWSYIHQCF